jgi:hypothetical protein
MANSKSKVLLEEEGKKIGLTPALSSEERENCIQLVGLI